MSDPIPLGLSFDDVLLVPQKSEVLPAETNLTTRLTSDINLNIPIVSSAMDTVTESELAIALAREGGMGVVHRNCPVDRQAEFVARVKRSENMVIQDPFTVTADLTMSGLEHIMQEHGVAGFPVVDPAGVLEGMVTTRDMWYIASPATTVRDVMTPKERLVTAPPDTTFDQAREILYKNRIEKLPLVDGSGRLAGMITAQDIQKRQQYSEAVLDDNGQLRVGAAIGVGDDYMDRAIALCDSGADVLFIDAATGHTSRVVSVLDAVHSKLPGVRVVAGNVVTEQGARDLCDAGAAAVKVGVGPGSICTTRVISGVGVPQFTAVQEVAKCCRDRGVPVIADGGIRYSGDMVKALAAGGTP